MFKFDRDKAAIPSRLTIPSISKTVLNNMIIELMDFGRIDKGRTPGFFLSNRLLASVER